MASIQKQIANLNADVSDIHTMLTALCYALGRRPTLDAEQLRLDLLEFCLGTERHPAAVAEKLATLLGQSILRGLRDRDAAPPDAPPAGR